MLPLAAESALGIGAYGGQIDKKLLILCCRFPISINCPNGATFSKLCLGKSVVPLQDDIFNVYECLRRVVVKKMNFLNLTLGATLSLLFAASGYCQPKDETRLETITVTANKREENVQKVPSAITALTEIDFEDRGIEDVDDLVAYVPNMNFYSSYIVGCHETNFRGIHMSQFTEKNPVVIFIDGIPQDNLSNYGTNIIDIERVEVLRGAQGTIYGKNAIGGVINIITKTPGNEIESKIVGETAENGTYRGKGYINAPIVKDKLFLGLSGGYYETRGYMKNSHEQGGYFDGKESVNLNSRLRWTPGDKTEVNFHANIAQTQYESGMSIYATDDTVRYYDNKHPDDYTDSDSVLSALNISYEGNGYQFRSITTYNYNQIDLNHDQGFMGLAGRKKRRDSSSDSLAQEFRVQSKNKKQGIKWLGGLFFSRETMTYDKNGMIFDTTPRWGYDMFANWADDSTDYTTAVFGQTTIPLPWRFALTGGLRYERIDKEMDYRYEVFRTDTHEILPGDGNLITYNIEDDWDAFLPKGVISWNANEDIMIYGSVSKGYLAGGFNWCEHVKSRAKFDEQTSIDYELGVKTAWFDNRLILNANLFYMDIKDMHVYTAPDNLTYLTSNAGEAHSQGVEIEFRAKPWRGVDLMASLGIVDAQYDEYTKYTPTPQGVRTDDCTGKKLEGTPEYTFSLAAQYRSRVGFFSRIELQGTGKYYFDDYNSINQDAYEIVNAKIGYEGPGWDVYFYGSNLLDKEYFSFGRKNSSGIMANVGEPQVFGMTASIKF